MTISGQEDPFAGRVIDERYRLRRRVGSGGMSLVYLAERVGMGKPVAIKFLRSAFANLPGFVRRFEQEAQACSRLNHLNCVSVLDFGVAFGIPYLVMEYVGGITLAEAIAKDPMPPRRALHVIDQVLAGLRHAHARSVVHRDLKPANVMLVEMTGTDDFAKIMDFGTAQILTGEEGTKKQGGTDIGTPWYMAPEQAAGQATDQRTDIYAVGIILFELLTGERPFIADDPMRVLQMHLQSPIPSPRALRPEIGLSPELEGVIVRAMQKRPDDRFVDAKSFADALHDIPEAKPQTRTTGPREAIRTAPPAEDPFAIDVSDPDLSSRPGRQRWHFILGLSLVGLATAGAVLAIYFIAIR
ncbi:MAG: serine/threonine protein kinase [Deltaproteobacteria bacterium]|nr:serine/threonine protein kinase [Deltaproteobacteria bacterium]